MPAFSSWEDDEFESSLIYITRPCLDSDDDGDNNSDDDEDR